MPAINELGPWSGSTAEKVPVPTLGRLSDLITNRPGNAPSRLYPATGERMPPIVTSRLEVPTWVWTRLADDRKTHILQAELLAIVAAYWTYGYRLAGRPVYHWCDNTGALGAATGGGASRFPGADLLTCMLHLALLHLRCLVHFDWVPSEANPADWPTRADKMHLIPPCAVWTPLHLPPAFLFSDLGDPRALHLWRAALSGDT
jgi:hypothetical protein